MGADIRQMTANIVRLFVMIYSQIWPEHRRGRCRHRRRGRLGRRRR